MRGLGKSGASSVCAWPEVAEVGADAACVLGPLFLVWSWLTVATRGWGYKVGLSFLTSSSRGQMRVTSTLSPSLIVETKWGSASGTVV